MWKSGCQVTTRTYRINLCEKDAHAIRILQQIWMSGKWSLQIYVPSQNTKISTNAT